MKKTVILSSLLLAATTAMAKVNPQKGYIITNHNDTIHGVIDYRGDSKNAYICMFRADEEQAFKKYIPQEIKGYRLADGGIYYITRTFPVNGEDKTFFAEFLLEGAISLFHHTEEGIDYFYFVDEEGKVSVVKDTHENDDRSKYRTLVEINRIKREGMNEGVQLFSKSPKTVDKLWESNCEPSRLMKLTKEYVEEFCPSSGECIEYWYNEKKSALVKTRFRIEAGILSGKFKLDEGGYRPKSSASAPQIGVGVDFLFPRFNKNISLQALVLLSHWDMKESRTRLDVTNPGYYKMKFTMGEFSIGPAYRFLSRSKVSPIIRGGLCTCYEFGGKEEHYNVELNSGLFGYYAGAGVDIDLRKYTLRLFANYEYRKNRYSTAYTISSVTVGAGFCF